MFEKEVPSDNGTWIVSFSQLLLNKRQQTFEKHPGIVEPISSESMGLKETIAETKCIILGNWEI
jgi:hypothetical protein